MADLETRLARVEADYALETARLLRSCLDQANRAESEARAQRDEAWRWIEYAREQLVAEVRQVTAPVVEPPLEHDRIPYGDGTNGDGCFDDCEACALEEALPLPPPGPSCERCHSAVGAEARGINGRRGVYCARCHANLTAGSR